ncbi:hypothetical protein AKUA2003_PHAGE200510 (plasmid) [Apilactobacillus kunkeei]|nr:hypothetical protein AKUA1001_PHAGE200510 [Apilactobacillus kunkeei]CAI2674066.1 hypothetical protein AKUA2003_PHAGE200510 [Apilactobacillus kunkeei]CAI2803597.1 hypothetical protein AKUA2002_PHAGE200510 [Apilactobacillus kunkeei]
MTVKQFRDTELTNVGFSVSNKAAIGKTQFSTTRAVSTDVDLSGYKIDDLKNLTSLPNEINSGIITDYDMQGNSVSAIKINFNNSNLKDGYVVRAVGMYAKENGSDKEFLHSITVSDSPVYIPAVSGNVYDGFYFTMAIFSGSNKNISIKIADETNATVKYVDDAVSGLSKDVLKKIDDLNKKITNVDTKTPETNAKNYADEIVKNLSDKSIKYQRNLTNDDDLLDVFKFDDGIYELSNISPKNAPHTNFSGKYIKLGNGTNSSFNLFTLLCVDETNSTVYMNFCYGWPLTNDGWKKLATDADIKSLVEKIDDLSSKGMVFRGVITDADLNDYNETGFYVYSVNGNKKNAPSENQSGLFFVIGDGQHVKQEIWNMQYGYTLTRGRNESYYWSDWTQTANTNYVDQNIRQVNANITGIQNQVNELNNKSTAQKTTIDYSRSIDSYTQPGTYLGVGMNPASWLGISNWVQNWDFVLKVEVYGDNIIQTIYSERKQYVRTNIRSWVNNQFVNNWHPWRNMTGYDFITDPVDIHSLPNGEYALIGNPNNFGYPVTKFNAYFSYLKVEGIRDEGGEEVKILTYMSPWRDIAYQYYTHIKGWGEWMQPTLHPLN